MKPKKIVKKALGKYAIAPYNFVSLPKRSVAKYNHPDELPAHNSFKSKDNNVLLNGYIEYTIRAETPIIVSKGFGTNSMNKEARFFVNARGKYTIPANTIRGLVRSNSQILSFSNIIGNNSKGNEYLDSEIEDSRFLYRDVAGNNSLAKKYKSIMGTNQNKRINENIRAGYIINKDGKYYIEEAGRLVEDLPYFRVDEIALRTIADSDIKGINYMYDKDLIHEKEKLNSLNKLISEKSDVYNNRREVNKILRAHHEAEKSTYKPYQAKISFEFDAKSGKIRKIGSVSTYSNKGWILSGGFINKKRSHYVVLESDNKNAAILIPSQLVQAYIDDCLKTKKFELVDNKPAAKKGKEFFDLPKRNERKPIFFIKTQGLHFGFTPNLRMFYNNTILDGVETEYKNNNGISYTDAIFGFSDKVYDNPKDKHSYKSRVNFEDAEAIGSPQADKESSIRMLLAEPKPTSYNLYLKQDKNSNKKALNIYEDNFRIRGVKQYWLKDYVEQPECGNMNMSFIIYPLEVGATFKGKIYFNNLDEGELGLLAWSLKLNEHCYQNIGLAKPFGFGRVKVKDVHIKTENLNKKYSSFSFDFMQEEDIDKYITIYKKEFSNKYLNGVQIEEKDPIKEFIYMKSKVVSYENSHNYRYMDMDRGEWKEKRVLLEISEYEKNIKSKPSTYKRFNKNEYNNKMKDENGKRNTALGNTALADAFNKAKQDRKKNK